MGRPPRPPARRPEPAGGLVAGGRAFVELCEFDGFGVRSGVRRIAEDFRANWDLVDDRVELDDPGPLRARSRPHSSHWPTSIAAAVVPAGDGQEPAVARAGSSPSRSRNAGNLRVTLEAVLARAHGVRRQSSMPGNKAKWKKHPARRGGARRPAQRRIRLRRRVADGCSTAVRRQRRLLLGAIIGRFVLDGRTDGAQPGRLEFHDLLVLARRLVATAPGHPPACSTTATTRILLDEFQDTDPIQLEIAVRLAGARPTIRPTTPIGASSCRCPGRLFIVGDPKQSIYRFRRADIAAVPAGAPTRSAPTRSPHRQLPLDVAVIDFVNDVFGRLITYQPDAQPAFGAARRLPPGRPAGPRHGHRARLGVADDRAATTGALGDPRWRRRAARRRGARRGGHDHRRSPTAGRCSTRRSARSGRASRATSACCSRPGSRCRRSKRSSDGAGLAVPGRELVGGLRLVRGARRAPRAARPPTTPPTTWRSSPRCARRSTGAATSNSGNGSAAGGTWGLWARRPTGSASTRSPTPSPTSASDRRAVGARVARRSARRRGRRAARLRPRPRRRRRPRRVAAPALRDRAGAGVGRRRRARAAALSAVGGAAGVREPGRRHDPARDTTTTRSG